MKQGSPLVRALYTAVIIVAGLLLALPAGCRQAGGGGSAGDLRGTLTISGAWALYPMVVRWGEEFKAIHPGVEFDISAGGAGKGMADVLSGAVDIGMVSRDVHEGEIKQGAFWVTVVSDAVVPTINAHNPHLTLIQSRGIDRPGFQAIWMGTAGTWGEVLGDTSITDEIHAFTRSDACGAAETWAAYLGGYKQEDLQGIAVYGDPGVAEAVSRDPLGIGFNNLNFAYDANTRMPVTGLAIAPIDVNGNGVLEAEENFYADKGALMAAIADGRYPSPPARGLHLVTKGRPTGLALAFIRWVLADGQAFAEETGYIPLTPVQAQAELKKLE
jgi:phosphate transport system substrate-binding protein